jgi:hypothetical protein
MTSPPGNVIEPGPGSVVFAPRQAPSLRPLWCTVMGTFETSLPLSVPVHVPFPV